MAYLQEDSHAQNSIWLVEGMSEVGVEVAVVEVKLNL